MKSLSTKKSLSKRRKLIILAVILGLVVAGVGGYYYVRYSQDQAEKQKVLERDRKAAETSNSSKKDIMNNKESSSEGLPGNSASTTSDQVPTSSALSVTITSFSQSNGYVTANAKTSGDGTCVFSYTKDGDKPATQQVSAKSGQCTSSIPSVEAPYGQGKLTVTYYSGGNKAEVSQNVSIN